MDYIHYRCVLCGSVAGEYGWVDHDLTGRFWLCDEHTKDARLDMIDPPTARLMLSAGGLRRQMWPTWLEDEPLVSVEADPTPPAELKRTRRVVVVTRRLV